MMNYQPSEAGANCVTIIGFPSCGKTTIGGMLAKELSMAFVDGDDVIREQMGKSLPQIMDERGPMGFIETENQILAKLQVENSVIAPGGSIAYEPEAVAHLASLGPIVYLEMSLEELQRRVGDLQQRGVVLKNGIGMSLQELWDERKPLYEQHAQITINTQGLDECATVKAVRKALGR